MYGGEHNNSYNNNSSNNNNYINNNMVMSVSLENYKGILLCDRPIAPSTSSCCNNSVLGDEGAFNNRGTVFVPSNPTGNPLGYAPSAEANALHAKHTKMRADNIRLNRHKNRKILNRHRRWLRSFANEMKAMKAEEQAMVVAAT